MKEVHTGRSTRMALPSATSTYRAVAKNGRQPIKIAVGHLEKEQKLDDALDEYCVLRAKDNSVTPSQFCDRYPSYRQSLRRLIDVQDAMDGQPALEDENWPELFSEFMGYEIIHELGVGAIARVYLASEPALGQLLVAIKVSHHGGDEAETLGKLTHPNIVPVFSVKHDEESELTAVCMPYHGSATLADLLELGFENGSPPVKASVILDAAREREQIADFVDTTTGNVDPVLSRGTYVDGVARIGLQLAEALAYTHEQGILHRDLKPSNVLLTPGGVPMLLDFNLASDAETGISRLGGTLPYMPPEQIRDVHLQPFEADLEGDPRSDVFSLAVILYELLTGKLPFGDPPSGVPPREAAETYLATQQEQPRPVRELNTAVSPKFATLLHQCLSSEPKERPASATELADELKAYFSAKRRAKRWASRHRGFVATFVLLLLASASASIWHFSTRPPYVIREYIAAFEDMDRGEFRDAIEHLDHTIKLHPDNVAFRAARGFAYLRLADFKQAEIDFAEAAKPNDDPVILECCAYSKMNMGLITYGPQRAARAMYGRMAQLKSGSAAVELNWAYANYKPAPNLNACIMRCTAALHKRPGWHKAYHLRALAHLAVVEQELKLAPDERDVARIERSTLAAKNDFNDAIPIEGPSVGLIRDTLRLYRLCEADDPSKEFQKLLGDAAKAGVRRSVVESWGSTYGWDEMSWFQDTLPAFWNYNTPRKLTQSEEFLTPPNYDGVSEYLRNYPIRLTTEIEADASQVTSGKPRTP